MKNIIAPKTNELRERTKDYSKGQTDTKNARFYNSKSRVKSGGRLFQKQLFSRNLYDLRGSQFSIALFGGLDDSIGQCAKGLSSDGTSV